MHLTGRSRGKGFTLVEVVIAVAILAVVSLSAVTAFMVLGKNSVRTSDSAFASQKVIQMMEELRAVAATGVSNLDAYDDEANHPSGYHNYILTTLKEVTDATTPDPGHVLSGNGGKKFYREVLVRPIMGEDAARRVTVRVYKEATGEVLAESVGLLRSVQNQRLPTQVLDLYAFELENVMGYWTKMESMAPTFQQVLSDLQNRNPGLQINTHYVTRLAYGRDPFYAPYVNMALRSDNLDLNQAGVYYYPGNVITDDGDHPAQPYNFFPPSFIAGKVNVDGAMQSQAAWGYPYTMADGYNNAVRYYDELKMYGEQVKAVTDYNATQPASAQQKIPEPSWRLIMEDMQTASEKYKNAIFMNLHGRVTPYPAMRNYSDPAKDPDNHPYARVVTHPENLEYASTAGNNTAPVRLRVYSFLASTNPSGLTGPAYSTVTINVVLPNIGTGLLPTIGGGGSDIKVFFVNGDPSAGYSPWQEVTNDTTYVVFHTQPGSMWIELKNSPLHNGIDSGGRGLSASKTLYGWEYIPCLVQNTAGFVDGSYDMTDTSATRPKNTARWVIQLSAGKIPIVGRDNPYVVETSFGDPAGIVTPGLSASDFRNPAPAGTSPSNMSRTYFWVGTPGQTAPYTERYQFIGDPRHMPYADIKNEEGYNWYFQDGTSAWGTPQGDGYLGFTRAANTWRADGAGTSAGKGDIIIDLRRYHDLLRDGLMKSNAFYTLLSGTMEFVFSLGGDISIQQWGHFAGLKVTGRIWDPSLSASATKLIHETKDHRTGQSGDPDDVDFIGQRLIADTNKDWFGRYWIGELYPDSMYKVWSGQDHTSAIPQGNLPVGVNHSSTNFFRAAYGGAGSWTDVGGVSGHDYFNLFNYGPASSNSPSYEGGPCLFPGDTGGASFFNGSNDPTSDNRYYRSSGVLSPATLTTTGGVMAVDLNAPLADTTDNNTFTSKIDVASGSSLKPSDWDPTASSRTTLSIPESYYADSTDGSGWKLSFYMRCLRDSSHGGQGKDQTANFVMHELAPSDLTSAASFVAKTGLMVTLRSFLRAGDDNTAFRNEAGTAHTVPQLPFVEITTPSVYNDIKISSTPVVSIGWSSVYGRWDTLDVSSTPVPYAGATYTQLGSDPIPKYNVKVSTDNGNTWRYLSGGGLVSSPAALTGVYDNTYAVTSPLTLDVSTLGKGVHIVRVEAYRPKVSSVAMSRRDAVLHYSYHERELYVSP